MLALLFSRSGLYVLLALMIGCVVVYVEYRIIAHLQHRLEMLDGQTLALQQENDDMQRDIAAVVKLQQAANQSLQTIRLQATQAEHGAEQRHFTGDSHVIQNQINQETAGAFGRLEALSHAQ